MADIMIPNSGPGAELRKILERELNLPKRLQWFEVRFAINEPVSVKCEFHAEEVPEEIEEDEGAPPSHGSLDD